MSDRCIWTLDDDDSSVWETTCRNAFQIMNDDGPIANGFKFCAYCGKPLEESRTSEDDED